MKKRTLGHSELKVSEIGLGCMNLGDSQSNANEVISTAIEHGINYIDTADLYGFGNNEKIVGKALQGKRDQVILATKGGNNFDASSQDWTWDPSKTHIKNAIKDSLSRLGVDYVDVYQLHGGTIEDPTEETIEAFEEIQQEGLIKYYGISSIRPNVINKFIEKSNITSIMMQYSLLDQRPEEFFSQISQAGISVVARGALGKGMLTSNAIKQLERKGKDGFLDYDYDKLRENINQLLSVAEKEGVSAQSLAIHYTLHNQVVGSLVLGASGRDQVLENIKAYKEQPSESSIEQLESIFKPNYYENHRE
ncbi:aldo/keto reductase [Halalkalibacillus halophilus]|uniref:aldo/keto reductase n=1 Tax=Halalkalibacillus halophilus TaxID=392827 RepID=UPI0003FA0379|nr:aldo/keto reductase [Halalkalibacillus halophilus]